MKEQFTAKTIEEAKALAVEKFGVSADQIVFRILEEPKKGGFLGIGKREAVIEAFYEQPEEAAEEKVEAKPVQKPEKKPVFQPAEEVVSTAKTTVHKQTSDTDIQEKTSASETDQKADQQMTLGIESEPIEEILTEKTMTSGLIQAKKYIQDVYGAMGIVVDVVVMRTKNGIRIEISNENKSGTIIGRRGETLDSIQYLVSILVNKDSEEYSRVLLDSNGYREKRRKTLESLAEKIAKGVLRTGRSNSLEPMNPYERRIIHSRISEIEGVSSRSVGEDPYRKVIVSLDHPKKGGYRKNGHGNGGKRPYREKKPEDYKRKNLDSMKTSFERDYKKPKPEDELNAGLYGKIEF